LNVRLLVAAVITCVVLWLALAVAVLIARPRGASVGEFSRLLPNVVRLAWAMVRDPLVPRGARVRLMIAVAYNAQPFNVIPDFVPVIGLADNFVITVWALRSAVRLTGPRLVAHHWRGTASELQLLYVLARLDADPGTEDDGSDAAQPEPM
jgi:uncharacterized membrane protein YkvA (DUF1232 family)